MCIRDRPKAAIVFDWENWWAVEDIEGPRKDMAYQDTILAHFKPFLLYTSRCV